MQQDSKIPMVEIYETVEGEGTAAGFPTIFIRLFGCNLRCVWCDTKYSYAPYEAEGAMSVAEIVAATGKYRARRLCLTGGEPLLYGDASAALLQALAQSDRLVDIHVETNGSIDLGPFLRQVESDKVRYIMDYKLSGSGEKQRMHEANMGLLRACDEVKFVIADERDFAEAVDVLQRHPVKAQVLFSPVWGAISPAALVDLILAGGLADVRLSMQMHKVIWDPNQRGV